jgi:hypothetical protein
MAAHGKLPDFNYIEAKGGIEVIKENRKNIMEQDSPYRIPRNNFLNFIFVISTLVSLYLAIQITILYLIILPVIYVIDRFVMHMKKRKISIWKAQSARELVKETS